jgi:hypothetical protein
MSGLSSAPKVPTSAVESFYAVREMPYAINVAHDSSSLERLGAGDCLAKSELLAHKLIAVGVEARLVRWFYQLPAVVPEVKLLPARLDLHRAVQACIDGEWLLVDATHDSPLAVGGLTVAEWDGSGPTEPAYPLTGPVFVEGRDDTYIQAALSEIKNWTTKCHPGHLERWRESYITWIAALRDRHQVA